MLSNPATLDLVVSFPHRVSEALEMTDFPPELLAEEEAKTGDLASIRIATALLGMLDEAELVEWRAIDTATDDPEEAFVYLLSTVDEADTIIAEELDMLFNELTTHNT